MAYTTINKSTDYFNTKLYTGDASSNRAITGVGFQPDWLWIKSRDASENHCLFDSVRGADKRLFSNLTNAEDTSNSSNRLVSFDTDGFTIGLDGNVNGSGDKYVSWNWKANGAGSTNYDGSITSTVSANTTAGFSIVSYTGTGSNATVGHGLGVAPDMLIVKSRDGAHNWQVLHKSLATNSGTKNLELNSTSAVLTDSTTWNNTAPTSSVFSVGATNPTNQSGQNLIAYCFAEKTGYSKFGSYTGNASLDGTFIYTGFKPAFVIIKGTNTNDWIMFDNKRNGTYSLSGNPRARYVFANLNNAEDGASNYNHVDFVSNGIKIREDNGTINSSGQEYIYMSFGQSLVGSNNVPCTAR